MIWRPFLALRKAEFLALLHHVRVPYSLDSTPSWSVRGRVRRVLTQVDDDRRAIEPVLLSQYERGFVQRLNRFCCRSTEYWRRFREAMFGPGPPAEPGFAAGATSTNREDGRAFAESAAGHDDPPHRPVNDDQQVLLVHQQTVQTNPRSDLTHLHPTLLYSAPLGGRYQWILKKSRAVVDVFVVKLGRVWEWQRSDAAVGLGELLFGNGLPSLRARWNAACEKLDETELLWPEEDQGGNTSHGGQDSEDLHQQSEELATLLFERLLMEICRSHYTSSPSSSIIKSGHYHTCPKASATRKAVRHVWQNVKKCGGRGVTGGGFTERLGYLFLAQEEVLVLYEVEGTGQTGVAGGRSSGGSAKDLKQNIVEKVRWILKGADGGHALKNEGA